MKDESVITNKYAIYNNDCVEVMKSFPPDSVHISIYSPPFNDIYAYSSDLRDMSNTKSYDEFLDHYKYAVQEIYRLTLPGRLTAVHCMDLKISAWHMRDFPGDIIRLHEDIGFKYHSRTLVWNEPLRIAMRTRLLGLTHKQIVKDSSLCHNAGADYILTFKKGGDNPIPIPHPYGMTRYAGEMQPPHDLVVKYKNWKDPKTNKLAHWIWQQYASSVWHDTRKENILPHTEAKEKEEERHIHPLQLDVIDRCLELWSNPGEIMLTPFMGIGSEVYSAIQCGRKGIGIELKATYYNQAKMNLETLDTEQTTLVDLLEVRTKNHHKGRS